MSKKALLVGVNYTSIPQVALRGCITDIVNISGVLQDSYNYTKNNITMLRDDIKTASKMPTRNNILTNLSNLVNQSSALSEIWFHYSGHGSQIKAGANSTEIDNLDEVIVPIDYQKSGFIIDDEIFNIIKNVKCKMILIFDCCHSGSMCDLQWSFLYTGGSIMKSLNTNKSIVNPNIYCFSGCKDSQTGADAYSIEQAQNVGAFTDAFIQCLRNNQMNVDILKLYSDICVYIKSNGFTQTPLFSTSSVSPNYTFSLANAKSVVQNDIPVIATTTNVELIKEIPTKPISTVVKKEINIFQIESNIIPVVVTQSMPVKNDIINTMPNIGTTKKVSKMSDITNSQSNVQQVNEDMNRNNIMFMTKKNNVKKSSLSNMLGRL